MSRPAPRHRTVRRLRTTRAVAVVVLVVAAGVVAALTLGTARPSTGASAPPTAPRLTADSHHDHALRTTDSISQQIAATTDQIARTRRALARCDERSTRRSVRACTRQRTRELRVLRERRDDLRAQLEDARRSAAAPTTPTAGTGFALMWASYGQARFRCTSTLTYRLNPAHAPANATADARSAFALVSRLTGYTFRYAGTTTETGGGTSADIVVSWTAGQVGGGASAVAVGGARLSYGGGRPNELSRGYVTVERGAGLAPGMGTEGRRGATLGRVLVHEIGHVMGLDHVRDPAQIMYGVIGGQTTAAAPGDRAGFAWQGRARACA